MQSETIGGVAPVPALDMTQTIRRRDDTPRGVRLRTRVMLLLAMLVAANIGAWIWAGSLFHAAPAMLGTALLAWTLGLRHAVDADHIAAIDNVTRKLMQDGARPVSVGLWFAIGHSAVILIASVAIAATATALGGFETVKAAGSVAATIFSAGFLFAIAAINLVILRSVWRTFRHVRAGGRYDAEDLDVLLAGKGPLSRLFRPLFRLITRPWHMAPLGFLFGLGFDTATEVAILGLSASQAADGFSLGAVLIFPALFAVGMALVDTADGIVMLGAYEWAFVRPIRKLYYNVTITAVSALVAVMIGGIETAALLADKLGLSGGFWDVAVELGGRFNLLGFLIIGVFATAWIVSFLIYRWMGLEESALRAPEKRM